MNLGAIFNVIAKNPSRLSEPTTWLSVGAGSGMGQIASAIPEVAEAVTDPILQAAMSAANPWITALGLIGGVLLKERQG